MKQILISIKPKWVAKILNGEKTIEIRKTMPKCDLPIDVYIYCTKELLYGDEYLCMESRPIIGKWFELMRFDGKDMFEENERHRILNGKVVAKFTLNRVDRYVNGCNVAKKYPTFNDFEKILTPACIYTDELENYCEDLSFYAWHISNLEIFDKPKELSEFETTKQHLVGVVGQTQPILQNIRLTKAPQSWCYIEVEP